MVKRNVELSIITPFYKGNDVISERLEVIENVVAQSKNLLFEWIIVNDSPEIDVKELHTSLTNLTIKKITNKSNLGIHQSRINGFNVCSGKYVLFLDQDDYVAPNFFKMQKTMLGKADFCVCNGYNEMENKEKTPIFKNAYQMQTLKNISTFFYLGNLIVSPGMVLIRKEAVPQEWLTHILKINGADDWLLWSLLLANKKEGTYCTKKMYIHVKTKNNTSDDDENMLKSCKEALDIFQSCNSPYNKLCTIYNKRLALWWAEKIEEKNKYIEYLKVPHIALRQMIYKIKGLI